MAIKCIIIDDELHGIITLEHQLKKLENITILATTQDSTKAKKLIETLQPDLIFLDIEMPNLNGFEVLQQFETINFKVIITTAYDQYAIKALKINALDYLLKPIDEEEFTEAILKFGKKELHTTTEQIAQIQQFRLEQMQDIIALSMQEGLIFVRINEIAYLEASGNYTHITLVNGKKHLTSKTLSVFEEVLQDHPIFFRAHKSYMVNLRCIKQYNRKDGGELIMQDEKVILLSRSKKQEFWELFQKI